MREVKVEMIYKICEIYKINPVNLENLVITILNRLVELGAQRFPLFISSER
jgi:hypothetical protein